jgi:hypothetical protein
LDKYGIGSPYKGVISFNYNERPDLTFYRVLTAGIASIYVGPSEIVFDAHIELLCDCSPYFNDAFDNRFTKAFTEPIYLPDVDPDTFADFLCWAYQSTLEAAFKEPPPWIRLCRLWALGDKLRAPRLQNIVIRWCIIKIKEEKMIPDSNSVQFIYNNTTESSPLRRFAVDGWVLFLTIEQFHCMKAGLPRQFLEDICTGLLRHGIDYREQENISKLETELQWRDYRSNIVKSEPIWERPVSTPPFEYQQYDPAVRASAAQLASRKFAQPRAKRGTSTPTSAESTPSSHSMPTTDTSEAKNLVSRLGELAV